MEKSLNIKYVLIAIIIGLAILFLYKKQENLDASGLSNEALQNIAKVYGDSKDTVSFNNINVTGKTSLNGDTTLGGNINGKKFSYVNDTGNISTTGTISTKTLTADNASLTNSAISSGSIGAVAFNNNGINGPNWYISNATNTLAVEKIILGGHTLEVKTTWNGIPNVLHLDNKAIQFYVA